MYTASVIKIEKRSWGVSVEVVRVGGLRGGAGGQAQLVSVCLFRRKQGPQPHAVSLPVTTFPRSNSLTPDSAAAVSRYILLEL